MIQKIKENKNFYLLGLSVLLFLGAFMINDPFTWFSRSIAKSEPLLQMSFENVDNIKIFHNGQAAYSLSKEDGNWYVAKSSQKYLSDAAIVRNTFEPLFQLNRFHLIGSGKKLIDKFSLNDNGWKVQLSGSQTQELFLAKAENTNTLVRLSKEDSVFGADSYLLTSLKNDIDYFRDKRILRVEENNLTAINIQRKNLSFRLEAKDEKNIHQWYIFYKGKNEVSQNFVSALQNFLHARADGFLTAQEVQAMPSYANMQFVGKSKNTLQLEIKGREENFYAVNVQSNLQKQSSEWFKVPYYIVENFLQPDDNWPKNWQKNRIKTKEQKKTNATQAEKAQ